MTSSTGTPAPAAPPAIDPIVYRRRWLILGSLCLCLVLVVASVSSLNVAIPTLARELRPTDTQILWIIDAYAVVFAGLLLFAGSLGDRFGRKGALLTGLVIFAGASIACAEASSPSMLIAFRAVMGIGASLIMPSTLSLLASVFPPAERPRAIAIWAGFAGAGGAIGPVVSGLLLAHFWYGSIFFVSVPIAVITFVLIMVLAPSSREGASTRLDPVGAVLSMVGFSSLLFGIIEGPEMGWGDPVVLLGLAVAVVGLVGFVVWERRRESPMLDMAFFAVPRFAMSSFGITLSFLAMFGQFFLITQYLQYVRGYSALRAAVAGLPFAATMIVVSPRAVLIASRLGVRRAIVTGMCVLATGLVLMSFATGSTPYPYIVVAMVLMAAGMATAMPSMTAGIMASIPIHKAGVGSAVNDTSREVGGAIGIALTGSIVSAIYRNGMRPVVGSLPGPLADQVLKGVGRAQAVIGQAGGQFDATTSAALIAEVRSSFLDGFRVAYWVIAAVIVATAAVMRWQHPAQVEPPAAGGAPGH